MVSNNTTNIPQPADRQSEPIVAMPESPRRSRPHTILFAHDSPRASYISMRETEHFGEALGSYPRTPPQAARPPLRVATPPLQVASPLFQTTTPQQSIRPVDFGSTNVQPGSPNINISVSFMNPNGFHQGQPPTNLANGDASSHFNNHIPFPDHQGPTRYNGLSWHMNNNPTPSRDGTPSHLFRRSLHTCSSDTAFNKGDSDHTSISDDATLLPTHVKKNKRALTTILLAVAATVLVVEEWVVGAVWALVLSKRVNGLDRGFARGYFESKAANFVGSALAAVVGLGMQWFLHARLAESKVALQLWGFILVFLTYMGCCLASGVARRLEY